MRNLFFLSFLLVVSCQQNNAPKEMNVTSKIIIAHRGASGYLPEHTLPAKAMAYAMLPDYIEQDVVLSKDNVPIVIHDIHLDEVTDVARIYPNKKRADGRYYVIDFTFDELKKLQVTERFDRKTTQQVFGDRFPKNNSRFGLHSLEEEIEMIQGLNKSTGHNIGIYPEIKDPVFHKKEGRDIAKIVVEILADYHYTTKKDKCILQCFDATELERIRTKLHSQLTLVQLIEFPEEVADMPHFATYADGIGTWIELLKDPKLMQLAKENNLLVHAYTLRADQLGTAVSFVSLLDKVLFTANVDGVFTDHPDQVKAFLTYKNN